MGKIKIFHFEASGVAYNLELGFTPGYVLLMNQEATAGEVFRVEWFGSEMGDSKEIQAKSLADNGSTGGLTWDYVSSSGNVASYNSKVVGNRISCTFDDTGGASEDLVTAVPASGNPFVNGEKVMLVASGGLPTNLAENTHYYVIDAAASTFRLSTTKGGTAVDFGSDGTAPNYVVSVDNMVVVGFKGITVAAAFAADGDEVWGMAIEADVDKDFGDIA